MTALRLSAMLCVTEIIHVNTADMKCHTRNVMNRACTIALKAVNFPQNVTQTHNAELTSPPPVGFDNKPDYGGGSG